MDTIETQVKRFLAVGDLAAESNEAESTWRKRIFTKQIAYVKAGRNVRVRREDFERWMQDRTVVAAALEGK